VLSQEQSLAIAKKVLRSSLGCIMYLRGIFPDEAFEDDNEHQVRIKRMTRGQNSEADLLLDWLEHGIFDALSRQYLRQLVVGISLDLDETEMDGNGKMVETYTFNFSYRNSHPSVQLEPHLKASGFGQHSKDKDKGSTSTLQTVAQVQGSIAQMLRRLVVYTQTLEVLFPCSCCASVILAIYYVCTRLLTSMLLFNTCLGTDGRKACQHPTLLLERYHTRRL